MLKSHQLPSGRIRIYWDGAALQAHAEALGDPSLNWLDLPALGRPAGADATHVWIAPAPSCERPRRDAVVAYGETLRALGVDCRATPLAGAETECQRCGHGWRDESAASELSLALEVLADAVDDAFDAAFIFASSRALAAIASPLGRLCPGKSIGRVLFGPSPRLRKGGPTLAIHRADVAAARLPPPGRSVERKFQLALKEASPCP